MELRNARKLNKLRYLSEKWLGWGVPDGVSLRYRAVSRIPGFRIVLGDGLGSDAAVSAFVARVSMRSLHKMLKRLGLCQFLGVELLGRRIFSACSA
jgi:hypothetical protein